MTRTKSRLISLFRPDSPDDQQTPAQIGAKEGSATDFEDFLDGILSQMKRLIFGADAGDWDSDFAGSGISSLKQLTAAIAIDWVEDEFTATAGQVTFVLSSTPLDVDSVSVIVNGVHYDDDADWTISGTTVTWLDTVFVMDAGDKVIIRYVA